MSREVINNASRNEHEMPILRIFKHSVQGNPKNQIHGNSNNQAVQELRQKIYTKGSESREIRRIQPMNIRALALDMSVNVEVYIRKVRLFFYKVMLFSHRCPDCNSSLEMLSEGKCRCISCRKEFDPTAAFQRCSECGGIPVLKIRRYECINCGSDIQSRFLFDGLVFDSEYFCQKMAESRQRKAEQRERVRQMLAESRSCDLPLAAIDLSAVPGLLEALNNLTEGQEISFKQETGEKFDLVRYENHIKVHIKDFPIDLLDIPPISENLRKDLIWRFIAIIFLAHAGTIDVMQHGQEILVKKHETNRERQGVFGESEEADGIERSLGGIEAW